MNPLGPPTDIASGSDHTVVRRRGWLFVAGSIALGIALDAVTDGPPGLGLVIWAWCGLGFGCATARPRLASMPMLVASLVPASFLAVRASPPLLAIDALAASGLVAAGAGFARDGAPLMADLRGYVWRSASIVASAPDGLARLAAPFLAGSGNGRGIRAIRSAVVVVPVVFVFAALLGSGDAVYAHYLTLPLRGVDLRSAPGHVTIVGLGAAAAATLVARMLRPITPVPGQAPIRARIPLPWKATLAAVDVVFAGFVAVQASGLVGGRAHVLTAEGLTFAEYARSGFWQLLAAAGLSGAVLSAAWIAGGNASERRRTFTALGGALVLLDGVVLTSALGRLRLYEQAFGFTWPRVLGHAAVLAIAAMLAFGLVAILVRRVGWLPSGALVVLFATVVGLNVVDPDRFIAERNLDRWRTSGRVDARELSSLSADAAPALVAALPDLPGCARAPVARALIQMRRDLALPAALGWPSWNLARARARAALEGADLAGPYPRPCG
jgi:hypothetical protein